MVITLIVNGELTTAVVSAYESLLDVLRDGLGLMGTKGACLQGECGSCTVIIDGRPLCSCLVLAVSVDESSIETIEGIADGDDLTEVQQAIISSGGVQCGFCTPGFIMTSTALARRNPRVSMGDLREELSGNLCRCTGYGAILRGLAPLFEEEDR